MKRRDQNYFVYADRLLGVEINDVSFCWIYGKNAPIVDRAAFDACKIRFFITVAEDRQIQMPVSDAERFQCFFWSRERRILGYSRRLFGMRIAYSISFGENEVYVVLGRSYANLVRYRFMNLHGACYLLSDLANIFLLKNGYVTLYCSAALHKESGRVVAMFAAPNTGKSYTVKRLCETGDYAQIAEDVAIVDKEGKIVGCPWTNSYRKSSSQKRFQLDDGGTFARKTHYVSKNRIKSDDGRLSDLILLSRTQEKTETDKLEVRKRILILNKYLFSGYNSPIVNVLAFFNDEFNKDWESVERSILRSVFLRCDAVELSNEKANFYEDIIRRQAVMPPNYNR